MSTAADRRVASVLLIAGTAALGGARPAWSQGSRASRASQGSRAERDTLRPARPAAHRAPPAWIAGRSDVGVGESTFVWLSVPVTDTAGATPAAFVTSAASAAPRPVPVRVALHAPPGARLWLAASGACDHVPATTAGTDSTWRDTVSTDTLFRVCVAARAPSTVRLAAVVEVDGVTRAPMLVSDPITARTEWSDPPAWLLTVFTTAVGFLSGALLWSIQRRAEQRTKRDEAARQAAEAAAAHARALEKTLVDAFADERAANMRTIDDYASRPAAPAPTVGSLDALKTSGLAAIVGPGAVAALADAPALAARMRRYTSEYVMFGQFNDAREEWVTLTMRPRTWEHLHELAVEVRAGMRSDDAAEVARRARKVADLRDARALEP